MYIASCYWRGSMNVQKLRTFDNEQDAVNYIKSIPECWFNNKGQKTLYWYRIYEVFNNKPPRLIKV